MTEKGDSDVNSHRVAVRTLIVIGALVAFLAIFSVWVSRQLLETQTWTETSTQLLQHEDIREPVSGFLVDALFNDEEVQQAVAKALPPQAQSLAGPATGGLRELAQKAADQALQRPRVQELWAQANTAAHARFVQVIEGNGDAVKVGNDEVVLDLGSLVSQLATQIGINVAGKIPPDAGQIVILKSDQVGLAQDAFKALRPLALVLSLLSLAIFGLAIFLAHGWRRRAIRSVGFAFIVTGLAVLATRGFVGDYLVDALTSTASVKSASEETYGIITTLLKQSALSVAVYGLIIVIGAWLAGPGPAARTFRRDAAAVLHSRSTAYVMVGIVLLLVFWWNPTPGTARLPSAILLVALAVAGMEAYRRQALADFPDETTDTLSERWRGRSARMLKGNSERSS